jgi:hypothetical protein
MNSKRGLEFTAIVLAALVALATCATLQQDQHRADKIAQLVNSGRAEELAAMSTVPFLLDQEILVLPQDVAYFWKSVLAAGYKLEEPKVERGSTVGPDSYREFRDSMEMRTFFKKYIKKGTRLLELKTGDGLRVLLLVRYGALSRRISGFKGPF